MTGYLVDTNIPSELTRDQPDSRVQAFLTVTPKDSLYISVLTVGEIRKGIAELPPSRKRSRLQQWLETDVLLWFGDRILPVTQETALLWGDLAASAKLNGTPLAVADGLIAATARHHGLILVTRNSRHFAGMGIDLLNPWEP